MQEAGFSICHLCGKQIFMKRGASWSLLMILMWGLCAWYIMVVAAVVHKNPVAWKWRQLMLFYNILLSIFQSAEIEIFTCLELLESQKFCTKKAWKLIICHWWMLVSYDCLSLIRRLGNIIDISCGRKMFCIVTNSIIGCRRWEIIFYVVSILNATMATMQRLVGRDKFGMGSIVVRVEHLRWFGRKLCAGSCFFSWCPIAVTKLRG